MPGGASCFSCRYWDVEYGIANATHGSETLQEIILPASAQNSIMIIFLDLWIPDLLHQYYQKKKEKVDETEMT
ncbi:unnamed protein product [Pieris brassicae]|uniref:Uncharacterized protein n=1 Tax=Pieris brassicae TaxID=7116 RepID=A0A9P0TER4_PIEBR|nr:unnamed protein product [Pieris brassicae]